MPLSEAKRRSNKKWNDANLKSLYDRIQLVVPKGKKAVIKEAAERVDKSLNAYVNEAVDEKMERESEGKQ